MTKLSAVVAAVLMVAACGGDGEPSGAMRASSSVDAHVPATCRAIKGSYRVRYTESSGNCGPMTETVTDVDLADAATMMGTADSSGCQTNETVSGDACQLSFATGCQVAPDASEAAYLHAYGGYWAGYSTFKERMTWQPDGSGARATLEVAVTGTIRNNCSSLYDVTYTRQ